MPETQPRTNSEIEVTRLLVVSRESAILRQLWSAGESNGWQLEIAIDPWEAIERVRARKSLDAVVMDLPLGSSEGLHGLRWLRRLRPELPIILIGHADDNGRRQEGIRMGARDYLVRPIEFRQLEIAIKRGLSKAGEAFEADITSENVEQVSDEGSAIGMRLSLPEGEAQRDGLDAI